MEEREQMGGCLVLMRSAAGWLVGRTEGRTNSGNGLAGKQQGLAGEQ